MIGFYPLPNCGWGLFFCTEPWDHSCMAQPPRIVVLGDLHAPFHHHGALNFALQVIKQIKPNYVIQIGDLYDFYSFGRFPRSLNIITPKDEIDRGRLACEDMWHRIHRIAPRAKKFQLKGNHDERPIKKLFIQAPELESIISVRDLFEFPSVETINSERDELFIGKICFMHGFRSKLGDHAKNNGRSTVCGHSHQGGCVFFRIGNHILWELNAGYLADPNTGPLSYTRQRRISHWTHGVGIIDDLGPQFAPYTGK